MGDRLAQEGYRGFLEVDVLVDGFGSCDLTPGFFGPLAEAGVRLRSFDPASRILHPGHDYPLDPFGS